MLEDDGDVKQSSKNDAGELMRKHVLPPIVELYAADFSRLWVMNGMIEGLNHQRAERVSNDLVVDDQGKKIAQKNHHAYDKNGRSPKQHVSKLFETFRVRRCQVLRLEQQLDGDERDKRHPDEGDKGEDEAHMVEDKWHGVEGNSTVGRNLG